MCAVSHHVRVVFVCACVFLHRAGRTARAGAQGRVTSLLQSKRDRDMGKAIQYALDNGMGLDQVSVNSGAEVRGGTACRGCSCAVLCKCK